MPTFAESRPPLNGLNQYKPDPVSNLVTIDVGGQLFQTTKQTLTLAGPKSLFSGVPNFFDQCDVPFIDRDPEMFSILLSLLRTGHLPSKAKALDLQDLISEAEFYGIENLLLASQSNPSQFEAFNLEKSLILPLSGRDSPSAVSTSPYGSVHVAHGSKITSFDWSLQRKSTILTQFTVVDSLLAISPHIAAAGATDLSGLQIIDLDRGFVKETLNWENVTRSSSTVQAIGSSPEFLFTSFESGRRNSNSIMVFDLQGSFRPVTEIGHCEIYGANLDSAIPATKLNWVPSYKLLMASGSHSGPSGVLGNIKFWDLRSGNVVWELKENVDCFSDVTVSDNLSALFKVGVNSGEVSFTDLRTIGAEHSWVCLGDRRKLINGKKEGFGCKIESHGNQVFCSKGGDLELWSEVQIGSSRYSEDGLEGRVFRKNPMGRAKDMGGNRITNLGFGGNKINKVQGCKSAAMALAPTVKVVLGSVAFAIFWVLAVFPAVPFLPIGRTAGSLLGAMLMVVFRVITPNQAYAAIDLSVLGLLFGTMVVSVYLERADMFKYLGKLLSWKCHGAKDLLCRICIISAISSALFTNDTSCVILTEFVLKIARQNNVPPHPFLLALASSANIGSSATPIGNPQNLVIAIQSDISFGEFVLGILPAMLVGVVVNTLILLCMFWRLLSVEKDEENAFAEAISEEDLTSHLFSPATMSHVTSLNSQERNSMVQAMSVRSSPNSKENMGHGETLRNRTNSSDSDRNSIVLKEGKGGDDFSQTGEENFPSRRSASNELNGSMEIMNGLEDAAPVQPLEENWFLAKRWRRFSWKTCVYLVTIGMLISLLMGLNMSWTAVTAALALMVLDFQDARPCLEKVSYSLLIFFCGMFITVNGFNRTGIPSTLWSLTEPHAQINHFSGIVVLALVILFLSNVASNVPAGKLMLVFL
ncbi:hypothetical protein F0562_011513 [Nyssa sinensis]|uniref:BTB domain-containing protein n=1 Tax=Nyssa sinensis TaxID=561372 RepID=A0A5J4ZQW4_9ASTE|nr:hypothetical protein F0562_011513 [Nyssa sinensis]